MEQYLDMFIEESAEHLQTINTQLLALEKQPNDLSIVQEIFRSAHTLKGMAATMEFNELANLTHVMENVLDRIRNNEIQVSPFSLDVIFSSVDYLESMLQSISNGGDGKMDVTTIVRELEKIETGEEDNNTETNNKSIALELTYDEFDRTLISTAKEQNQLVLDIHVHIDESSVLKGARAFMVSQTLEGIGEIIKSSPATEDLESGDFDTSFKLVIITKENSEVIRNELLKISEVRSVEISEVIIEETVKPPVTDTLPTTEQKPNEQVKKINKNQSIRVNIDRLDKLMNLFEELIVERGQLEQISNGIDNPELVENVQQMKRITGELQNIILNMRMVQVDTVFNRFPRMVRQLSKELGKDINFVIEGKDTELDRTVIDELGDPLVHLIRNALDHGIEAPENRKKKGKPETGNILLKAYPKGNHVYIEVKDDGNGLNQEKILNMAIENNVITREESTTLTDDDINQLIFASGFSTAETVSNVSGRGVGLDVVRNNIEKLNGNIRIYSEEGKGSTFSVELPLTLSIIASMLVGVRDEKYAIPLSSIVETAKISRNDIKHVHEQEVFLFRDKILPLVFLDDYLQTSGEKNEHESLYVVIVQRGSDSVGLVVDELIGQKEIVLKSLGNYMKEIHSISGATILGNGTVALIIDTSTLIGRLVNDSAR